MCNSDLVCENLVLVDPNIIVCLKVCVFERIQYFGCFSAKITCCQAALQLSRSEVSTRRGGNNPLNGGAVNFGASSSSRQVCLLQNFKWSKLRNLHFAAEFHQSRSGVVNGKLLLLRGLALLFGVRSLQVSNLISKHFQI